MPRRNMLDAFDEIGEVMKIMGYIVIAFAVFIVTTILFLIG